MTLLALKYLLLSWQRNSGIKINEELTINGKSLATL
jgi:hypothetical protein